MLDNISITSEQIKHLRDLTVICAIWAIYTIGSALLLIMKILNKCNIDIYYLIISLLIGLTMFLTTSTARKSYKNELK